MAKEAKKKSPMKTGVVLSGGGSAGAAQVGALKVITKILKPDVYIGTSVGAINGAALAAGLTIEEVEDIWLKLKRSDVFAFNPRVLLLSGKIMSIYSNRRLKKILHRVLPEKFEDLNCPLYINATNLTNSESEYFSSGNLVDAILASSAVPPFLPPYEINGNLYIDGGVSDLLGVQEAEKIGCRQLIIVNSYFKGPSKKLWNWISLTTYTLSTIIAYKSRIETICETHRYPDKRVINIQPRFNKHVSIVDFDHTQEMMEAGRLAAEKKKDKICSFMRCQKKGGLM